MKFLSIYLFLSLIIFPITDKNKVLTLALNNLSYSCNTSKKIIKFEGIDFIGHLDTDGKPYGEWYLKDMSIRQCFLENEEMYDYKDVFVKQTEDYYLFYHKGRDIYIELKKENNSFFFESDKEVGYKFVPNKVLLQVPLMILPYAVKIK